MKTLTLLLLTVGLFGAGCIGNKDAQVSAAARKRTFVPVAATAKPVQTNPKFAAVKIRPFRTMPPYDTRSFIIRRSGGEFASDFYNGWLVPPNDLIRAQTARYLEETRLFRAVYDASSGTLAPLSLEGVIQELYLDYSAPRPAAVVTLRLLVLNERSPDFSVLFTDEQSARVPFNPGTPTAAAEAFGTALTQALEALAQSLAAARLP